MITETGTLPIGVEYEGKTHREFEVRPRLVRDSIEISAEQSSETVKGSVTYLGLCFLAKQIVRIGDISKEAITPALLMDMYSDDGSALQEAAERVESRLESFRSTEATGSTDNAGAAEAGV